MGADRAGELDERLQAAATGLGAPAVEQLSRLGGAQVAGEDLAQALLEPVGAPCRPTVAAQLAQRDGLGVGQALGALEQYPAGALEPLGLGRVHSAQLVPDLAADLIERVGGELDHVERVDAHGRLGGVPGLATDFKKAGPMSVDTVVSRAARSAPSSAKNRSKAAVSLPSAPHTTLPLRWSVTSVR